ncbi:MAG TPA: IPTL-CTERM sorting domain-containing protein, partial [Thermoanaerobaculia bacterium]|nr:IPTL-CTERM sorting domain-containing protein [Thermoanaerobaculia bacterium]
NASATTTTQPFGSLSATKSVSGSTLLNGNVTYLIVVHNAGPIAQGDNPGDELVDILPSSLVLVSATADTGIPVADIGTNTVHWNGALAPGSNATITIVAHIPNNGALAGTVVTNQATLHFDRDSDGTNESTAQSRPAAFVIGIAAVPTLSEWMLGVLAASLVLVGCRMVLR